MPMLCSMMGSSSASRSLRLSIALGFVLFDRTSSLNQLPQFETESSLLAENQALRAELTRWQTVGDRVAAREAWAAQALGAVGIPLLGQEPAQKSSSESSYPQPRAALTPVENTKPERRITGAAIDPVRQPTSLAEVDPVTQASYDSLAIATALQQVNQHARAEGLLGTRGLLGTGGLPSLPANTSVPVPPPQPLQLNYTSSASSLLTMWKTSVTMATATMPAVSIGMVPVFAICFIAIASLALAMFQCLQNASLVKAGLMDYRYVLHKACHRRFDGALRRVGITPYWVEISEIHVGSLCAGHKVNVRFSGLSSLEGQDRCSEATNDGNGAFLRFAEVFRFEVRSADTPLVLSVLDERGEVARMLLPAADLLKLARRPQQQYFRTELSTLFPLAPSADGHSKQPYAAMRIRDITQTMRQGLGSIENTSYAAAQESPPRP